MGQIMNRSEMRHALYRAKNGIFAESKQHIYDLVEPKIPVNESWDTFSKNWDIFYKDGEVTVIRPEVDYDFIHTTCLEKSLHVKNKLEMQPSNRQLNAIQIVELSMLEGKMDWESYNKDWGVSVDLELKRINTKLYVTDVNAVSEEMIKNSAPSDGSAMTSLPEIPTITLDDAAPMTSAEIADFNTSVKKKDRKRK